MLYRTKHITRTAKNKFPYTLSLKFLFFQNQVWNSVDNWIDSMAVLTLQFAFQNVGLYINKSTKIYIVHNIEESFQESLVLQELLGHFSWEVVVAELEI